jgi:hypothetical protein
MDLENELAQMLLKPEGEERTKVWVASYDQLYRDLPSLAVSSAIWAQSATLEYRLVD